MKVFLLLLVAVYLSAEGRMVERHPEEFIDTIRDEADYLTDVDQADLDNDKEENSPEFYGGELVDDGNTDGPAIGIQTRDLGHDSGPSYPNSCDAIRRKADRPLASGTYQVYQPETFQNSDHGFNMQATETYCEMDGPSIKEVSSL